MDIFKSQGYTSNWMKSLLLAALLCQAFAAHGAERAAAAKPAVADPVLSDIERKLTEKQRERREGRLKPDEYVVWEEPVRDAFAEASSRAEPTPENTAVSVRIRVLLGDGAAAKQSLNKALEIAPQNPELIRTKGLLLYEAGDYPGAAKHGLEAWEKSGRTDQSALALYQMSKGRRVPAAASALDSVSPKTAQGFTASPPNVAPAIMTRGPVKPNAKPADVPLPSTEGDSDAGMGLLTALGVAAGVILIAWGALPKETKERYINPVALWNKMDRADHRKMAVSAESFLHRYKGWKLDDVIHESDVQPTKLASAEGPDEAFRYVIMPTNPDIVLDMRHFLVVGQLGETAGLGIEAAQAYHKLDSAFQSQDLVSNHYGAKFFSKYNPTLPWDKQLSDFFKDPDNFDRGWKIK